MVPNSRPQAASFAVDCWGNHFIPTKYFDAFFRLLMKPTHCVYTGAEACKCRRYLFWGQILGDFSPLRFIWQQWKIGSSFFWVQTVLSHFGCNSFKLRLDNWFRPFFLLQSNLTPQSYCAGTRPQRLSRLLWLERHAMEYIVNQASVLNIPIHVGMHRSSACSGNLPDSDAQASY